MSIIRNLVRKSIKNNEPATILTFCHDGMFDYDLCRTPHTFYGAIDSSSIGWSPNTQTVPYNFKFLPNSFNVLGNDIGFDLVLCNSRQMYEKAHQFSNALHLPIVIVDHLPYSGSFPSVANIHTTPILNKEDSTLIEYMVEEQRKPVDKDIDVLICGKFVKEEYPIIKNIMENLDSCLIIGDNEGISDSVHDELYINYFDRSRVYINLSTSYGVSKHLLQAMASGCAIISSNTDAVREILGQKDVTYITDAEQAPELVKNLLNNADLKSIGARMRDLAKARFNPKTFTEKWTDIFYQYKYRTFVK